MDLSTNHSCSLDPEKLSFSTDGDQSVAPTSSPPTKGSFHPHTRPPGGWRAASLILSMELCERLATLGIGLNLVTYLHDDMHLSIPRSANIVTNFLGTSSLTCLLGGFIADTYLGRYGTVVVGSSIQLLGIILMVLSSSMSSLKPPPCEASTCKAASWEQLTILYIALYLIAFGTGGIKSSVSGLGADQFEEGDAKGRRHMQSYFNWFGMAISIASMVAVTVLVYVQDNQGRGVGYGACAVCMAIALALFLGGTKFYRFKPPAGSALTQIAHVLVAAWRNRHLPVPLHPSHQLYHHGDAWIHESSSSSSSSSSSPHHHQQAPKTDHELSSSIGFCSTKPFRHTTQFLFLDRATLVPQSTSTLEVHQQIPWRLSSLEQVEEVKMFFRLFPILATTIVFWTANAQMLTFSIEQGATLNRRLGSNFQVPPASLFAFVPISILLTIPFYDRVLIPLTRKWRDNEHGITSLQRIGIGLIFSTLSMVVATLVEKRRLQLAHKINKTSSASFVLPMSIFYLAPQYVLMGIGDAFSYIGQLEFFFRESPHGMRSLGTGICLSAISFGFFLSSALVSGINKWTKHGSHPGWLTNNLNIGRLDDFYLLLTLSSFLNFLAYLLCSYWYEYNHTWYTNTSHQEESICNNEAM